MAYQPPYSYGSNPYGGVPYAYGGQPGQQNQNANRDALLKGLAADNAYQYPTNPTLTRAPNGNGLPGTIADASASVIAGTPAISRGIVGAIGGGDAAAGLGAGATMGIGVATELASQLLKPKVQQATASPFASITDQYGRRHEGSGEGVLGGAVKWGGRGAEIGSVIPGLGTAIGAGIGALGGAIGNAFTKNAASAYSDFTQQDARDAITKLYAKDGQKPPTTQELDQILKGQGWKPGDRWVGEKGLYSTMTNLDGNFKRQALQQQLAGMPGQPQQQLGPDGKPLVPTATAPPGATVPTMDPNAARLMGNTGIVSPQQQQAAQRAVSGNTGGINLPGGGMVNGGFAGRGGVPGATGQTVAQGTAPETPATTTPDPTTPPASTIPAGADTDGYAAPAYTAPKVGNVMPGWDATKFADPNHQTPKYVVGRLLSNIAPTIANMDQAVAEIAKAYPGATRVGNGDVQIPGLGTIDILQAAGAGGKAWQWDDGSGGGAQQSAGAGGSANAGAGISDNGDVIAQIIARLQGLAGNSSSSTSSSNSITSNRDALLAKIGA